MLEQEMNGLQIVVHRAPDSHGVLLHQFDVIFGERVGKSLATRWAGDLPPAGEVTVE